MRVLAFAAVVIPLMAFNGAVAGQLARVDATAALVWVGVWVPLSSVAAGFAVARIGRR